MFDFIRDLTKSEAKKRQEAVSAYLDDALTPKEKARFKEQLKVDLALNDELKRQKWVKQSIQTLPRAKAPRNYMLDPAIYGKPARQVSYQLYPVLRTATILSAVLFIFLIGLDLVSNRGSGTALIAEAPVAEMVSSDSVGTELQELRLEREESVSDESAVEEPAEEPAPAVGEEFFAAQPAETSEVGDVTLEAEAEAEMGQPAAESEPLEIEEPVEEAPAEGESAGAAESIERLPSEQSEGQPSEEVVEESAVSEDGFVEPLPPSEPLTELADATAAPLRTQTPAPTLAASVEPLDSDEFAANNAAEESAAGSFGPDSLSATAEISELPTIQPEPDNSDYPGPALDLASKVNEIEERSTSQEGGLSERLPDLTMVEIILGVGLLSLLAITILLRRRIR